MPRKSLESTFVTSFIHDDEALLGITWISSTIIGSLKERIKPIGNFLEGNFDGISRRGSGLVDNCRE